MKVLWFKSKSFFFISLCGNFVQNVEQSYVENLDARKNLDLGFN